jgi:hypothetical protein
MRPTVPVRTTARAWTTEASPWTKSLRSVMASPFLKPKIGIKYHIRPTASRTIIMPTPTASATVRGMPKVVVRLAHALWRGLSARPSLLSCRGFRVMRALFFLHLATRPPARIILSYSPYCLVGKFSEVRVDRVLRSSALYSRWSLRYRSRDPREGEALKLPPLVAEVF